MSADEDVNGRVLAASNIAYLVSSARQVILQDGTPYPAGHLSHNDLLWPYQQFARAGIDTVVITADGAPPSAHAHGPSCFFDCTEDDARYLASIVATFAERPEDVRVTLHQYADLGLTAARRLSVLIHERGLTRSQTHQAVATAARTACLDDRPLAETVAATGPAGLTIDELRATVDAQRRESQQRAAQQGEELVAHPAFRAPVALSAMSDKDMDRFDALFVPDGYGAMVDLFDNPDVRALLGRLQRRGVPIAVVGYGAAALLSGPERADGQWGFEGYRLTATTSQEEDQTLLGPLDTPWRIDVALMDAGAVFDEGRCAWKSRLVVDRNLISGQNPASAKATVTTLLSRLGVRPGPPVVAPRTPPSTSAARTSSLAPDAVVRAFLSAVVGQQQGAAMGLVSTRASITMHPQGSVTAGRDALQQFLDELLTGFPNLSIMVDQLITTDDVVTVLFRAHGTQSGTYDGTIPHHVHIDLPHAWRFVVTQGLITDVAAYWCQAQLLRQLAVNRYDEVAIA